MRRLVRWIAGAAVAALLVVATIVLVRAFDARTRYALKPWHRVIPGAEAKAAEIDGMTFERYLAREEILFREVATRVGASLGPDDRTASDRYWDGSPLSPSRFPRDWNRTFELAPAGEPRGAVLLVHGLTDAPYSMRAIAELYRDLGWYALGLRVPGHGTVPGALVDAEWRDWAAAVRMAAKHARSKAGAGKPLHLVGYSNGGALCVDYALDAALGGPLPRPDRLVLVSPMIGVTPFAGLAPVLSALGRFPYFEASRWLDVMPEYVPFKYVSFPANAGAQTAALTSELRKKIRRAGEEGKLGSLPPVLTFVSLVDATVLTPATIRDLYGALGRNGSELVVFDINRSSELKAFLLPADEKLMDALLPVKERPWRLSVVTNAAPDTLDVVERATEAGTTAAKERPLGLSWPRGIFSLSHVALPFPPDDPLFGGRPGPGLSIPVNLGTIEPRGERSVLSVPIDQLMRLTWNPFFAYLAERVREVAGSGAPPQPPDLPVVPAAGLR